jgi:hypothetical protein
MDRRSRFFALAAFVCALLIPLAAPEHKWLAATMAIVYVLLALASWADSRSRDATEPPADSA